ncbi:MAG TPA: hypothetical protein ENI82_04665 [Bacteroidetes bacterium]|nr:hypothetical protein [Bacteroidota bacterium]
MKKEIKISDFSAHLFWDVDRNELDIEKDKAFIIQRILEYGLMADWKLIQHIYGLQLIKKVALNARELDDITLSFLSTIFNLKKQNFRCYRLRQSKPSYWSY